MTIGMRRAKPGVTALLASGLVLAATAACGSSGGNSPKSTGQPGGSGSTGAAGSSSAVVGTPADPATLASVTSAYKHFFSGTAAPAVSQQALQHGAAFKATLEEQAKGQYSKNSGVEVGAVSVRG